MTKPPMDGEHCPFCGEPLRVVEPLMLTGGYTTAWEEDACDKCGKSFNLGYKLASITERLLDEDGEDNGREGPELLQPEPLTFDPRLTPDERWKDDHIQFMRLLAEISMTVTFTMNQLADLSASMDLPPEDIMDVLDRALVTWDAYKETIP